MPDIAYAAHKCVRLLEDPQATHLGITLHPDQEQSFKVHANADFVGNWNKGTAMQDPSTAKSRSGYIVFYAGCPIIWASKLQTQ
eukprot:4959912-Ditylum_brightwellii.AAC.1